MLKIIELEVDDILSGETGVFEVAWVEQPAIEQEMVYFGRHQFYKAPEYVSQKACQAIKENEKRGNPAGTQVGKIRARQLCNRDEITIDTIKRMKSFLERAATYNSGDWDDNGTIAYGLWGGEEALTWVDKILNQVESEQEMEIDPNPCWEGYEPYGLKPGSNGDLVPNCIPVEQRQMFVDPSAGESKDEYVSRCIKKLVGDEGYETDQAAAICYSTWDEQFAPDKISFDWDETLTTEKGKDLLEKELARGNIVYIISARNTISSDMLRVATKYRFPVSHIYATGSNLKKVEKIKELGIKRHYDNNPQVIKDLGVIGIRFDYDTNALPPYVDYPQSGDTEESPMLIEPTLMCGCDMVKHDFNFNEYSDEELEAFELMVMLKRISPETFQKTLFELMNGLTEQDIKEENHNTPTVYFKYIRNNQKSTKTNDHREFCMLREDRYFRRMTIDLMRDLNPEFGHGEGGGSYSKWLYKGGPNCIHAWEKYLAQGPNLVNQGIAQGLAGEAPCDMANSGYYSEKTKKASERAYAISQSYSKMDKKLYAFNEEQRMIYTPLMIPNILIPRLSDDGEIYYVKFTPESIEKIQRKFMIEQRTRDTNLEHSETKFKDVVMVESWLVSGEQDKAYELGYTREQVPQGSWMGGYKVLETEEGNLVWEEYIKPGKVKGASVEGNFILNFSSQKQDEYLLEQIINILNNIS